MTAARKHAFQTARDHFWSVKIPRSKHLKPLVVSSATLEQIIEKGHKTPLVTMLIDLLSKDARWP